MHRHNGRSRSYTHSRSTWFLNSIDVIFLLHSFGSWRTNVRYIHFIPLNLSFGCFVAVISATATNDGIKYAVQFNWIKEWLQEREHWKRKKKQVIIAPGFFKQNSTIEKWENYAFQPNASVLYFMRHYCWHFPCIARTLPQPEWPCVKRNIKIIAFHFCALMLRINNYDPKTN